MVFPANSGSFASRTATAAAAPLGAAAPTREKLHRYLDEGRQPRLRVALVSQDYPSRDTTGFARWARESPQPGERWMSISISIVASIARACRRMITQSSCTASQDRHTGCMGDFSLNVRQHLLGLDAVTHVNQPNNAALLFAGDRLESSEE